MANEGATLYYESKQFFKFDRNCDYLAKYGLFIKHPDTQLITGMDGKGNEFIETKQETIKELIHNQMNLGVNLWLENKHRIFWSFLEQEDYFYQNFSFESLEYTQIEEEISQIFIRVALNELAEAELKFLGFTLDQFGHTDHYSFEEIFESKNQDILSNHYISDITFLPRAMMKRVVLDSKSKIISLNKHFDCINKNKELSTFLESLL